MEEKEQFDFSLDDILKEFGSGTPAEDASTVPAEEAPRAAGEESAETAEEPFEAAPASGDDSLEDLTSDFLKSLLSGSADEAAPAAEPETASDSESEDEDVRIFPDKKAKKQEAKDLNATVRFTPVGTHQTEEVTGSTQRLDTAAVIAAVSAKPATDSKGDTQVFAPITEEQAAAAASEGAEPFSAGWEPKYEEPMGEYVPPEPIVFRPRSRLRELKKKLVAGPERRYYALAEEGLGKYQISMFLGSLVVILAVAAVCLYQMGMVQEDRMRLLVFGEMFAMLLAGLLGSGRLLDGFFSIFKGKFTLDSLLTVTFVVCIVDAVFCLQEVRVPFCAAFCLEMVFSLWAEYERRNTEMGMMDTMRKATRLNRVAKAPDCHEGRAGFYVEDGEVEDFMDHYNVPSRPEKVMNVYALIAFLLSGGVGLAAGLLGGVSAGFRVWSAAILMAAPASAFISQTRPMAVLERRMHKLGVVLCGWQGVKAACGNAVVPLTDADLFPAGSVKVNGVKFYSQRDPDQTVSYATAVIEASGMGIANLFTQLRDSRYGRHYTAENFRYYENGGLGGEVCGEPVLVGSLTFLQEMGVEMPEGAKVSQAVYVAVDGELCGVFAMAFGKLKGVSAGLGTLCGYRKLTPVLVTGNFLLSESFIRAKFNANTRRMAFPSLAEREKTAQWKPDPEKREVCALTTQEGIAPLGFAITGARALRSAVRMGTWMHIFGGIVGMAIVLVLTLVEGGAALLTPTNLLLLELIWALPGLLITEWTRRL